MKLIAAKIEFVFQGERRHEPDRSHCHFWIDRAENSDGSFAETVLRGSLSFDAIERLARDPAEAAHRALRPFMTDDDELLLTEVLPAPIEPPEDAFPLANGG
jgi:hypothetical protein